MNSEDVGFVDSVWGEKMLTETLHVIKYLRTPVPLPFFCLPAECDARVGKRPPISPLNPKMHYLRRY